MIELRMLKTPILFTIFNREDTASQVFAQIKAIKPQKLYIASDGPRQNKEKEAEIVEKIRKNILSAIDWKCEVKTLFRETNLGCKNALSSGITWFFEQEEEGIILEDDCVPHPTFFEYAEKMLEKYRNDDRIMVISGTNYLPNNTETADEAYFIRYFAIWGWATWRRAWQKYDISMKDWPAQKKSKILYKYFEEPQIARHFESLFDDLYQNNNNTWDIQWVHTCLFNNALAVVPSKNLISNVGTTSGTHTTTKKSWVSEMPTYSLNCDQLQIPDRVFPDVQKETELFTRIGAIKPFGRLRLTLRTIKNAIIR